MLHIVDDMIQGTPEWLGLRKSKITSTDASVIMEVNPWKTKLQLYNEKISDKSSSFLTERMQRGLYLEPIARDLFIFKKGLPVYPAVVIKDWAMASLDGMSECRKHIVEIKCPGDKDHSSAIDGIIPSYYYPQLQHQLYVCDLNEMSYFSFDGIDGVTLDVKRDQTYIDRLIEEEKKFYECLINKKPPEPTDRDYVERDDALWEAYALKWKEVTNTIKSLESEEEELRRKLIFLSEDANTKGSGISLCQVQRKGIVDYSKIPELKGVNLDLYRKESTTNWRISCQ